MDKIVSLCKRRGFLFQSSEIYGGVQGFWDYGPLGVELKRNLKDAWWQDMISSHNELIAPPSAPTEYEMVGLDCTIIMHPQVWKCSGHYDLFHDHMVDCRESKKRYRFDQVRGRWCTHNETKVFVTTLAEAEQELDEVRRRAMKFFKLRPKNADELSISDESLTLDQIQERDQVLAPDAKSLDTLTEPREFNLMFKTTLGALGGEDDVTFLRPETAQGIFVNFKNVVDTSRVKIPFGIGQVGKSFRNEITPRNFTFRSREFEQMEIEFFCHPEQSKQWYQYWRDRRMSWYTALGLSTESLIMREHHQEELAHYSIGTADIEYAFPFLPEGEYGELEGIAHRGDFDLRSHMEGKLDPNSPEGQPMQVELNADGKPKHKGSGKDLSYRDPVSNDRFVPHVIEPSAGADRAALAFLCEAYTEDKVPDDKGNLQERTVMRLHPRLAPVKAAIFPLVKKDGMPEIAKDVYSELKRHMNVFYDDKGAVGKRYRRQDEAGTPYCITVDTDTLSDNTVTVRDRDSLEQVRVKIDDLVGELNQRLR
ncbi:glycine--tRNA ligase [Stieleria sp. JC731]|uniref:glycine--tRNA ligase n=1 Tax=Pirellulaceae TaxID=2691357 RepID=UPI001E2932CF|nr:glycine--tRNA ligase [Stieleria sp. JC731]MCC9599651.1 glycine--tRNA ligase [Stieleria sp. JC731]